MFFVIRKEEKLSSKANFIVQLLSQNSNIKIFYVYKKESEKFKETWCSNRVQLSSSIKGLMVYYLLMFLKSPKDFRDGLLVRLSLMKSKHVLTDKGFLSILSNTLYLHFGTSARVKRLMQVLNKLNSPMVFIIDEFISLKCVDLEKLHLLGSIIFVSQDIGYNRFGFGDNFVTKKLMFKLERDAIIHTDLVVACSERERLKYVELGAKNTIFYPNLYPTKGFEPSYKDKIPSICIVLREHWGSRSEQSVETIFKALAYLNMQIRVYMIGIKPKRVPKNVILENNEFIPNKLDYLKIISKSWLGINVGIHLAGTNGRKYDYAEAGTVVFSDRLGVRGDLLPYEYAYVDHHDLAAKIGQLFQFGRERLLKMGQENRKVALSIAENRRQELLKIINNITFGNLSE